MEWIRQWRVQTSPFKETYQAWVISSLIAPLIAACHFVPSNSHSCKQNRIVRCLKFRPNLVSTRVILRRNSDKNAYYTTKPNWMLELLLVMTGSAQYFWRIFHIKILSDVPSCSLRGLTILIEVLNCSLILQNQKNLKNQTMKMRMSMLVSPVRDRVRPKHVYKNKLLLCRTLSWTAFDKVYKKFLCVVFFRDALGKTPSSVTNVKGKGHSKKLTFWLFLYQENIELFHSPKRSFF